MNPILLKEEIIKEIKIMPAKTLPALAEFVDFLREKDLEEDIMNNKKLIKSVKQSKKAWRAKKFSDFIPWAELKK
ncbi:hypothetical protein HZB07_07595 [Candidatus Saganbacteria bacterium]|nr:hypothetical protein [Candidatus Saganbacteria bacterium]